MTRKNLVNAFQSKEALRYRYVFTVFPHEGTPTLPTTAGFSEYHIQALEGDKHAASYSYAPRVTLGPPINSVVTLPRSFYASDVCRRVLDLVIVPHVRVHVVGCSNTTPPTFAYLRVYACEQLLQQEIREWGALLDSPKWHALLSARDASIVVESSMDVLGPASGTASVPASGTASGPSGIAASPASVSASDAAEVSARICDVNVRIHQTEYIEGPSLAPCFGPMQWGPTPSIWGKDFEDYANNSSKHCVSGVFRTYSIRTPRIEVASVRMLVEGIVEAQARSPTPVRKSLLGATKLATRATLLVLDAELVELLCYGCVQQPLAPHILIDCGPDGELGPFAPLCAEDVTQCGVIIVSDKALLRHAASEEDHIELFGIALARAASQRQGAYLRHIDKKRALVARLAAGTMPKWTLPLSMYQWQRVIVSQKCGNSAFLDILQRDRWALVEDAGCAEPGAGMSVSVAKTAARLQGLPDPTFESATLFGHLQLRSIVLCAGSRRDLRTDSRKGSRNGSANESWTCLVSRPSVQERQTRSLITKMAHDSTIQRSDPQPQQDQEEEQEIELLPLQRLRLALGVFPCALEYEKAVACTVGARAEHLLDILEVHVPTPAIEYTRAQLRRIADEKPEAVGDCCVCMSETATIITFCGHLFCEGCMDMLVAGSGSGIGAENGAGSSNSRGGDGGIRCTVCRAVNYYDDLWKLRMNGPLLRPLPAMLHELVQLAAAGKDLCAHMDTADTRMPNPFRPMPLLVAVPSACMAAALAEQMSDGILQMRRESHGPLVSAIADVESIRDLLVSCTSPSSANCMEAFVVDAATLTAAFAKGGQPGHTYRIALVGVDMPCEKMNADYAVNADVVQTWDSAIHALVEVLRASKSHCSFTIVACGGASGQSVAACRARDFSNRMQGGLRERERDKDKEPRRNYVLRSDTRK